MMLTVLEIVYVSVRVCLCVAAVSSPFPKLLERMNHLQEKIQYINIGPSFKNDGVPL